MILTSIDNKVSPVEEATTVAATVSVSELFTKELIVWLWKSR